MGPGSLVTADAQGAFAFSDLAPGDYYLVAGVYQPTGPSPNVSPHVGCVPTYYPGSSLPSGAVPIKVRAGEETRNADFAGTPRVLGTVSFSGVGPWRAWSP